jgi:uncharacterized Zn finger protein (UPF0148 family)
MSEDFDKEAERKRLREKYEADREDREATERMSELLLQGATMTNKHCDTCGTPIFRYQGQEFCPTCEERKGQAAQAGAEDAAGAEQSADGTPAAGADEAGQPAEGQAAVPSGSEQAQPQPTPEQAQPQTREMGAAPGQADTDPGQAETASGQTPAGQPTAPQSVEAGSLEDAQASLIRTITTLSRRAEATDDPRQAKELLAAAKEAAETLARLRGR